jgi:phage terminase large subunit-like protein
MPTLSKRIDRLKKLLDPVTHEPEIERRRRYKLFRFYPDEGPLRRELYPKHVMFFRAGGRHEPMPGCCPPECTGTGHRERAIIAANRIGKTEGIGAYETALHLTGEYPPWWEGRRWERPIKAWAAGDTAKTVREIVQEKLVGPAGAHGTGMIPGDRLLRTTAKTGVTGAIDTVYIRHAPSGGVSTLLLKSYDQRREAFQGTEQDLIWLDEEPPLDIYTECLLRTMTTDGQIILTFTPLRGLSEVVLQYLPNGVPS